jgi:hypothetical protein
MLYDFSIEHGVQIVTATHAPDFIAETPIECLLWVDRSEAEAKPVSTLARALVDLGSISNTDAVTVNSARAVLFVEGSTDRRVLSAAFEKCGLPDPASDPKVIVAKLPDGKSSADSVRMLPPLLQGLVGKTIAVACLVDNDWQLLDTQPNKLDGSTVCLTRKEIENFLIEPSIFSQAAAAAARQRHESGASNVAFPDEAVVVTKLNEICESVRESVQCQLVWRYRVTLPANLDPSTREQRAMQWFSDRWSDPNWRLGAVPGKQVLARLRHWCQHTYRLTLSTKQLLEALSPVPTDLRESLGAISRLLYPTLPKHG